MEDRFFKYALVLSLLVHIVLVARFPYVRSRRRVSPLKEIEVVYHKVLPKTNRDKSKSAPAKSPEKKSKEATKILLGKKSITSSLVKDISKLFHDMGILKEQPEKAKKVHAKRKIVIPPIKSEKISNPVYLNYYQLVRSKIKERAYVNYTELNAGKVYVTFIIESKGDLKQIKLIEEKTSADKYLKEISLQSVKEAAPFSPFPKDLNYPELTFNISISFEVEE